MILRRLDNGQLLEASRTTPYKMPIIKKLMIVEAFIFASLLESVRPVQTGWRPIDRPLSPLSQLSPLGPPLTHPTISYQAHIPEPSGDGCTLYKAVLDQEAPIQYVQYKAPIPDMKEFTLCMWHKFYNHSRDQPLFSYSANHERVRDIYSWVSNSGRQSFYMLSVMGHTLYRLNYPVRLHKWYHLCQSWNGRTGEWQTWINSERVGRGFYNLLVGRVIKGGGTAITGQEPGSNAAGSYQDIYKPASGLLGEVTLVQLYKAALTAGKAYTNHKHHHAHKFHHDDRLDDDFRINPFAPNAMLNQAEPQTGTEFPFIRNGQLIPQLPVHELSAFRGQQGVPGPQMNILSSSPLLPGPDGGYALQRMRLYKREHGKDTVRTVPIRIRKIIRKGKTMSEEEDELDEDSFEKIEKRDADSSESNEESEENDKKEEKDDDKKEEKKDKNEDEKNTSEEIVDLEENKDDSKIFGMKMVEEDNKNVTRIVEKRDAETEESKDEAEDREGKAIRGLGEGEKVQKKRTALLGDAPHFGVIPGSDLSGLFNGDGYILGGGGIKFNDDTQQSLEKEQVQMEPAEWEVRSIMAVCSGCSEDPFRKASIVSWRETPKKLYSGVLYIPAIPECQRF